MHNVNQQIYKIQNMKPIFIAGPCVIESAECLGEVAKVLVLNYLNSSYV